MSKIGFNGQHMDGLRVIANSSQSRDMETMDDDAVRLVVLGEASMLSTAIIRGTQRSGTSMSRSASTSQSRLSTLVAEYEDEDDVEDMISDPLLRSLIRLKAKLRKDKLVVTDPNYLRPFCEVIKNKDVSGPITGLALQSILKFINYGLSNTEIAVQMIADSVTKARFIGTDTNSDEVVLMRILNVLKELIIRRYPSLTNGAVCEIMQSCFRIAFEPRLSEMLRKSAEQSLVDMVQVLFQRIPEFNDEYTDELSFLKMGSKLSSSMSKRTKLNPNNKDFANKQSIRFNRDDTSGSDKRREYYGLASIHELLSYLTSLINPLPEGQNTEAMINVGLTLLTVSFETSVVGIGSKHCLISTVKTDLCWNLMQLLQSDRPLNSFAAALRLSFLIFTNLRMHLKYQFEALLIRLMDIITTGNAPFEFREIAAEYLVAFFRHLSHLPHEIYFNYDCDPFASNLLEDLLQLFSKNCFTTFLNPQTTSMSNVSTFQFTSMQMLSLDALLAILKGLQKAELGKDEKLLKDEKLAKDGKLPKDVLVVHPATTLVNVFHNKTSNETTDKSTDENQVPNIVKNETNTTQMVENLQQIVTESADVPQDVDVGSITSEQSEQFVESTPLVIPNDPDVNSNDNFETINPNELNDNLGPQMIKSPTIKHNVYVSYKFPKPENVAKNTVDIMEQKNRKAMFSTATELFNTKPAKGIQYLQENDLIQTDSDIVSFLRDNPKLDKKQIGEYLSNKKNLNILQTFVESFAFKDTRIDEALRTFLESFRLPGEAPLISMILEHFAHHWCESNGCPFASEEAAFCLSYAVIMLNVDQHNTNAKRQNNPMTYEEFKANLRQVNGGQDFDPEMLKEIYFAIKANEIIMPAEQQGLVRDRYLWKCLLRNSETENGVYWHLKNGSKPLTNTVSLDETKNLELELLILNGPMFSIFWGPTVAAMTFIFDKINPEQHSGLTRRLLNNGFNSCALLCSNYGHLDNLVVSLSKFIMSSSYMTSQVMPKKSELAAQCMFGITKEHANEMRESWSNLVELILNWYNSKLLNDIFEVEDFALDSKKIKFRRKDNLKQKPETDGSSTFLSSFYSYFAGNQQQNDFNENNSQNTNETDSNESTSSQQISGQPVDNYCQPLLFILQESKMLTIESLLALIKALIEVQLNVEEFDDDIEVFKLEILLKIILMNRDRVSVFWPKIYRYLLRLIVLCPKSEYLAERVVSAVFRLAIRFIPRSDSLNEQIFLLLCHLLLTFEPNMIQKKSTSLALHSFVSQCSCYITRTQDWAIIFNFLLAIGIGFQRRSPKKNIENDGNLNIQSDNEDITESAIPVQSRGYTSDSELDVSKAIDPNPNNTFRFFADNSGPNTVNSIPNYRILDLEAYEKSTEILTLIIREVLPNNVKNFQPIYTNGNIYTVAQLAVDALQRFVEASIKIQISPGKAGQLRRSVTHKYSDSRKSRLKSRAEASNKSRLSRIANAILSSSESEDEEEVNSNSGHDSQPKFSSVTETCALRLLDLMHFFHLNAALTVENTSSEFLWSTLWCPLLQGIALFCCDSRRPVRTCALTFLQRALLLHDLRVLSASQWENCFNKVLFPLLSKLLDPINMCDPIGMDETRMRTTNLLCKVFLQHLTPLLTLSTFTALWLTILDFMDKYMRAEMQTDLVKEAIPESIKNILLVMETAGCFRDTLAAISWDRIGTFLPNLYDEMVPPQINPSSNPNVSTPNTNTSEENQTTSEPIKEPMPSIPIPVSDTNTLNDHNICPPVQDMNQQSRELPPTPPVVNSLFIDMEEGLKRPLNAMASVPVIPSVHNYQPMATYPGTIEPFVPMPSNPMVSNMIQRDANIVPNAQLSAYPWPAPSDHKNL